MHQNNHAEQYFVISFQSLNQYISENHALVLSTIDHAEETQEISLGDLGK